MDTSLIYSNIVYILFFTIFILFSVFIRKDKSFTPLNILALGIALGGIILSNILNNKLVGFISLIIGSIIVTINIFRRSKKNYLS